MEIKNKLKDRFGPSDHPLAMRANLSSVVQNKETLEEFGEKVSRLAFLAYDTVIHARGGFKINGYGL